MQRVKAMLFAFLLGCGDEAAPATVATTEVPSAPSAAVEPAALSAAALPAAALPAAVEPAAVEPAAVEAAPEEEGVAPAPLLPEVDLLHAVASRVAVSSAYRDDPDQAARLVDGDLETAWNSRTQDLVGAWIELEVPSEARVRAIAMTTGYTHVSPRADLFVGNHRITRVRLSRDGVSLGEHALDTAPRTLVEIPVDGPGGHFRIEVLATLPGTRDDWQEVCVSELRVLGSSPLARADSSRPQTSIGPLAAHSEVLSGGAEADEPDGIGMPFYESVLEDWPLYAMELTPAFDLGAAFPPSAADVARITRERSALFQRAREIVEDVDGAFAASLARRASRTAQLWTGRDEDLALLLDGYDLVAGPERRCAAASVRAHVRVQTIVSLMEGHREWLALALESGYGTDGERLTSATREAVQRAQTTTTAFLAWVREEGVRAGADSLPPSRRRSLLGLGSDLRSAVEAPSDLAPDWAAARAALERAERDCEGH